MPDLVRNPMGEAPAAQPGTVAQSEMQKGVAEVQAAMLIARANPRDPIAATERILAACARHTLAASATYDYARGGTGITGASIRLAEVMAQGWGNMQYGLRELDQGAGFSDVQAYAWDIETNVRREVTFRVPHWRDTRSGGHALTDARDIYETVANMGQRRVRACILAIIPGDVQEAAVEQCEATLKDKVDATPEARKRMVEAFAAFGVTQDQIEKRVQRRLDAILPQHMIQLGKIATSLKDGMSKPSDWFEVEQGDDGPTSNADALDRIADSTRERPDEETTTPEREPGEDDD